MPLEEIVQAPPHALERETVVVVEIERSEHMHDQRDPPSAPSVSVPQYVRLNLRRFEVAANVPQNFDGHSVVVLVVGTFDHPAEGAHAHVP